MIWLLYALLAVLGILVLLVAVAAVRTAMIPVKVTDYRLSGDTARVDVYAEKLSKIKRWGPSLRFIVAIVTIFVITLCILSYQACHFFFHIVKVIVADSHA